ncbi:MAG: hypothetical protein K2G88_09030 [Oscillospiraceae bacterium]|nr:hypothetical protein [Oscillospiraceae bacterium]MDE6005513.1 hypothetical protein [Oscillospiraceae bacterium]MDE6657315.1 hypothetical protein [Oscillospiraceae bacterium]
MVSNFSITVSAEDTLSNIGGNSEETIQTLLQNDGVQKFNAPENEMNDLTPISEPTEKTTTKVTNHSYITLTGDKK